MTKEYLDKTGLSYLWAKIKSYVDSHSAGGVTLDAVYPVGSIYLSTTATNPGALFGGTWEQIEDTFLLAAGSTYSAGTTGGEATHTLTQTEMPSHAHTQEAHAHRLHMWSDAAATGSKVNAPASTSPLSKASFTDSLAPKINSTGGGQAHNNMPPYLSVYVWKRTA